MGSNATVLLPALCNYMIFLKTICLCTFVLVYNVYLKELFICVKQKLNIKKLKEYKHKMNEEAFLKLSLPEVTTKSYIYIYILSSSFLDAINPKQHHIKPQWESSLFSKNNISWLSLSIHVDNLKNIITRIILMTAKQSCFED